MSTAHINLMVQQAVDLHRAGRIDEAVRAYRKVLRKDARAVGALNLLGLAEFQRGRLPEAADALTRAARLNPDLPNVDYNLARVLQAQGRNADALKHYEKAVARAPGDTEALSNLGTTLAALGRHDDAIVHYRRALAVNPGFADAWHNLGNALKAIDRYDEALAAYGELLKLRPNHVAAIGSMAYLLCRLDRPREAIAYARRAVAAEPDVVDHRMNLANALAADGEDDAAEAAYDGALALDPASAETLWNKGLFLLSRGRFAQGWPLYERRWDARGTNLKRRPYTAPHWSGAPVDGTLLVWAEQGLGDQVLYASMMTDLRGRAEAVTLEVDPRLVPLMARSLPGIGVVARNDVPYAGPVAAQAALGGIGRYLRPDAASFRPAADGYLKVDTERAAALRARLRDGGRRVVGLSWASVNREVGRAKSARLAELAPVLALAGCRFIDLQYGDTSAERAEVEAALGVRVEHLDDIDNTNDIDGLAALMAACDAVVSVSNTNAHLAAAQGKATFVLLSDAGGVFWYWMKRGETTPVYASARLFRKSSGQSWSELAQTAVAPRLRGYLDGLPG